MDKEKELMEKHHAFIKPEKGIQNTLMGFGFECGKGWHPIIERLFDEISKLNPPEQFEITQVKEKYGVLTVYADCSSDEVEALIDKAEAESAKTCEDCGQPGTLTKRHGWYRTLCPSCACVAGYELNKIGERENETDGKEEKQ